MTPRGSALTLASINIERSKHMARVVPFLRARSPDVVCLQEVVPDDVPTFRDELGYSHHVCIPMARFPEHGGPRLTGIGIFSRHPFEFTKATPYAGGGSGTDVIDRTSEESRFRTVRYLLAVAGIRLGGDVLTIATTHFPWTDNARTSDFQRTACDALLRALGDRSLVLCGDFNSPRGKEIFSRLAARWTDHIPPAYTSSIDPVLHRAAPLDLMVDGLFSTSDFDVSAVELHQGVSDHCAITAVIRKRSSASLATGTLQPRPAMTAPLPGAVAGTGNGNAQRLQRAAHARNQGRLPEAEQLYRAVLAAEPRNADALAGLGDALLALRCPREALDCFERLLAIRPANVEALCNRAVVLLGLEKHGDALASLDRALAIAPTDATLLFYRGNALQGLNRLDEALASFDRLLAGRPNHARTLHKRGEVLLALKRYAEALQAYDKALTAGPENAGLLNNRALALIELGRPQEALAGFEKVLAANPGDADAQYNCGNALALLDRLNEAVARYDRALALRPDHASAHNNRGNVLRKLSRHDEAVKSYDRALAIEPRRVDAHYNRGNALLALGNIPDALASYRSALAVEPRHLPSRWAIVMSAIPAAAASKQEIDTGRAAFAAGLEDLAAHLEDGLEAARAVQQMTPFYLAYDEEDNRELFARYGALCARAVGRPARALRNAAQAPARLRLGIVSAHIRKHSVWDALLKGILQHLDRSRIDVDIFHLGARTDAETDWARASCAHFEQGPHAPERWVERILARRPDVLLYPEIGMDFTTTCLASQRLADLQVATWGHPHTSGLPTIDCFFSAAAFEPPEGQRHYTERLISLPRLGCCVAPSRIEATPVDLAALGIAGDRPLLLSPGTPYKYAPQHDWVFPAIAGRLGRCAIAFFVDRGAPWSRLYDKLLDRLAAAFTAHGSSFSDHCVVIPWQQQGAFQGLLQRADLMLDTIGFSGFNTALQAVECGLPIVTREGRFMRGRLAGGVFGAMGLEELIAGDEQAYVDLAVSLAADPARLRSLRNRIEERRKVLFGDVETVREFETTILELSGRRGGSGRSCP